MYNNDSCRPCRRGTRPSAWQIQFPPVDICPGTKFKADKLISY